MVCTINVFDTNFAHCEFMDAVIKPKLVKYVRNVTDWDGVTLFTDNCFHIAKYVKSKYKIAVLLEPPAIHPHAYENVKNFEDDFDYIFTFVKDMCKKSKKYVYYAPGPSSTFIREIDWGTYDDRKTKLVSMVTSNKKSTKGHLFRYELISKFKRNNIDLFGENFTKLPEKKDALVPYAFTIVVKNSKENGYFSDHIMDPLLTGTVPIYWGTPDIGEYFDKRGILSFDTIDELNSILDSLSFDLYKSMIFFIHKNFKIAKEFACTDDQIVKKINSLGIENLCES